MSSDPTTTNTTNAAGNPLPPLPADHLSHPEQWATGGDPATSKQKGFINVLAAQHPDAVPQDGLDVDNLGKSEASEVIEKLKNGQKVESAGENDPAEKAEVQKKVGEKRKADQVEEKEEQEGNKAENDSIDTENKADNDDDLSKANGTTKKAKNTDDNDDGTEKNGSTAEKAIDVDANGDEKEEGQTTLDGAFKTKTTSAKSEKSSTADKSIPNANAEEKEDRPSESKKPRTDNSTTTSTSTSTAVQADTKAAASADDTIPGDDEHLDHPENWTTGDEPATGKQKGYLKVLEKQTGEHVNVEQMGKSEASEKIDELRSA